MKQSFLSLLWAAILAGIMYFLVGNIWVTVGTFFVVLHASFFSLCMVYCDNYSEKFLSGLLNCSYAIILGGLGLYGIVAVFIAFFVGSPLYFVITGKNEVF